MRLCGHFLLVIVCCASAWGSSTARLNNAGSPSFHEVTVSPGETFPVDVNLVMDRAYYSFNMRLGTGESNVFSVADFAYTPFFAAGWGAPAGGINPETAPFGWNYPSLSGQLPAGSYHVATALIGVAPSTPAGAYTLNLSNIALSEDPYVTGWAVGVPGPDFTVHVVPEPTAVVLLGLLLPAAMRRRRGSER